MSEVPEVADPLYGLVPAEFVAARDALAKQLRADGDRAQAAVVAKLRRPSPVAFALNQIARTDPGLIEAALAAGAELRDASAAATDPAGGAGAARDELRDRLRQATAADRAATNEVVSAAIDVLRANDLRSAAQQDARQELAATVRAAVLDTEVADPLRAGQLTTAHDASGFGFALTPDPASPPPRAKGTNGAKAAAKDSKEATGTAAAGARPAKRPPATSAKSSKAGSSSTRSSKPASSNAGSSNAGSSEGTSTKGTSSGAAPTSTRSSKAASSKDASTKGTSSGGTGPTAERPTAERAAAEREAARAAAAEREVTEAAARRRRREIVDQRRLIEKLDATAARLTERAEEAEATAAAARSKADAAEAELAAARDRLADLEGT